MSVNKDILDKDVWFTRVLEGNMNRLNASALLYFWLKWWTLWKFDLCMLTCLFVCIKNNEGILVLATKKKKKKCFIYMAIHLKLQCNILTFKKRPILPVCLASMMYTASSFPKYSLTLLFALCLGGVASSWLGANVCGRRCFSSNNFRVKIIQPNHPIWQKYTPCLQ